MRGMLLHTDSSCVNVYVYVVVSNHSAYKCFVDVQDIIFMNKHPKNHIPAGWGNFSCQYIPCPTPSYLHRVCSLASE